jgi:hypothetical protein
MTQLIRLIWRLDYDVSYVYFDRRGAALKVMTETVPGFFSNIAEGAAVYSFVGDFTDPQGKRTLSVEPTSINGLIEWNSGTDLERVFQLDVFRSTDKIVRELLKLSEVRRLKRAGLRLVFVANGSQPKKSRPPYKGYIDDAFAKRAEVILGEVDDVGLIVEGRSPDALFYRLTCGPLAIKNIAAALAKDLTEEDKEYFNRFNVFGDLDLYELNFQPVEASLFRLSQTKLAKAVEFAKSVTLSETKMEA